MASTVVAIGLVIAGSAGASPAAGADDELTLDDFPAVTQGRLDNILSVHHYTNLDGVLTARTYDANYAVHPLATVEQDDDETVVTLTSDILFAPDSAKLSAAARKRIGADAKDIPKKATVQVDGHTDSVDSTAHNLALSKRRAQAVADAIGDTRSDLRLKVHGYGESRPKVSESGDDIDQDRATNRRVEVRYSGGGEPTPTASAGAAQAAPTGPLAVAPEPSWDAVVADKTFDVPDHPGLSVRVGVESYVLRGKVAQLSVLVEPTSGGKVRRTELLDTRWSPSVVDQENLVQYSVLSNTGLQWSNDPLGTIPLEPGHPVRYVTTYPAPVQPAQKVDVTLHEGWPVFTDVPVTSTN